MFLNVGASQRHEILDVVGPILQQVARKSRGRVVESVEWGWHPGGGERGRRHVYSLRLVVAFRRDGSFRAVLLRCIHPHRVVRHRARVVGLASDVIFRC